MLNDEGELKYALRSGPVDLGFAAARMPRNQTIPRLTLPHFRRLQARNLPTLIPSKIAFSPRLSPKPATTTPCGLNTPPKGREWRSGSYVEQMQLLPVPGYHTPGGVLVPAMATVAGTSDQVQSNLGSRP